MHTHIQTDEETIWRSVIRLVNDNTSGEPSIQLITLSPW